MGAAAGLRVPLVGLISGTACSLLLFALAKWISIAQLDAGRYTKTSMSLLIFAAVGFLVGRAVRRSGQAQPLRAAVVGFCASLLGVAAGVMLWTRTLFSTEIALLWMFGAVPILIGVVVGMVFTQADD